jgi:hypothetical protein
MPERVEGRQPQLERPQRLAGRPEPPDRSNSPAGRKGYTSVMCGIHRPILRSCSARIAWIGGQADPGGMTTKAVLWVTSAMIGSPGWRSTSTAARASRLARRLRSHPSRSAA